MTFTASNGVRIKEALGGLKLSGAMSEGAWSYTPLVEDDEVAALREYFLNERDEALGIWRSPDYPQFALYAYDKWGKYVRVIDETSGHAYVFGVEGVSRGGEDEVERLASKQYFEAHRAREPWEDAKDGDMWLVSPGDGAQPQEALFYSASGVFRYADGGYIRTRAVVDGKLAYRKEA